MTHRVLDGEIQSASTRWQCCSTLRGKCWPRGVGSGAVSGRVWEVGPHPVAATPADVWWASDDWVVLQLIHWIWEDWGLCSSSGSIITTITFNDSLFHLDELSTQLPRPLYSLVSLETLEVYSSLQLEQEVMKPFFTSAAVKLSRQTWKYNAGEGQTPHTAGFGSMATEAAVDVWWRWALLLDVHRVKLLSHQKAIIKHCHWKLIRNDKEKQRKDEKCDC